MPQRLIFDAFGLENLKLESYELGPLAPDHVRVRMEAASLNYRDLMMVRGHYNPRLKMPLVPCSDGAGIVEAIGSEIQDLEPGDRVVTHMVPAWRDGRPPKSALGSTLGGPCDGCLREVADFPINAVLPYPENLLPEQAACLPVAGLTAWHALTCDETITAGSKVLLLGTGGVSIMALQIAKKRNLEVTITSSSDDKLAHAAQLGADHCINYKDNPDWDKAVRQNWHEGADLVLEVGGDGTFDRSVKATRMSGTIALIGVLAAQQKAVDLTRVLMHNIRIQGILTGSVAQFAEYLLWMAKVDCPPTICTIYPGLEKAAEAFELMAAGQHFGKVVIKI